VDQSDKFWNKTVRAGRISYPPEDGSADAVWRISWLYVKRELETMFFRSEGGARKSPDSSIFEIIEPYRFLWFGVGNRRIIFSGLHDQEGDPDRF
jgi:hypothetical protein